MFYLKIILIILWATYALKKIFFLLFFLQIKEYRIDRIKGDLKKSLKVFLPKTDILMLLVLLSYAWDKGNNLVSFVFFLLGVYAVIKLVRRSWKLPKFTEKATVLLATSIIIVTACAFAFRNSFFLFIVLADLLIPFAMLLLAQIFQIPTNLIKNSIYQKAREKILSRKDLVVIGITGSYGKSSTKEFLCTFLSKKYKVLKTSGNINTEIGVAQTILKNLRPEHKIFVAEMGAYRRGEVSLLCDIIKPKIGIVTGVNEQHLALFGTMENLLMSEGGGELAEALPSNGTLFVNGDNRYCLDLYKRFQKRKKIYGLSNKTIDSDIWSEDIEINKDHVSFIAVNKNKEMAPFKINVLGRQNVQNLLGAILVARELGMSLDEISEACNSILPEQAGMVLRNGKYGINVVDSSYSSNPDGVYADLDYFNVFSGKKVIIMPCLIELGEKSVKIHEKIGKKIGQVCDLAIITTKDKFKEIEKGFNETKKQDAKCVLCDNSRDIYSIVTLFCKSGDAILLEGRVPSDLIKIL